MTDSVNDADTSAAIGERSEAKGRRTPRNLGPVSMKWLEAVAVRTLADIEELGAVEIYLRVRDAGFVPSRNLLWALQGAILDLPWNELPPEMKAQLEREVEDSSSERELYVPELPEIPSGL